MAIGSGEQRTIDPRGLPGLESASFSTIVESDFEVVVERTMTWGERRHGSHSEGSLEAPQTTWYLGEGATHSGFQLFYLLQNPSRQTAVVTVTYLLPEGRAPKVETYLVAPESRRTIWVNLIEGLEAADISATIEASQPIVVERAMYRDADGETWAAGHGGAGLTGRSNTWVFGEGATGPYFDLFILLGNPDARPAHVRATYLLPEGAPVVKEYTLPGQSRTTLFVDVEDPRLQDTAVSTVIEVLDNVPIVAERSMWWGQPWVEAHVSRGATSGAPIWAFADGELGGADQAETFLLLANTSLQEGRANVTLYGDDGVTHAKAFALPPTSRINVEIALEFPTGRREALWRPGRVARPVAGRSGGRTLDLYESGRAPVDRGHQCARQHPPAGRRHDPLDP